MFARGYNGAGFAINQYDKKLKEEFARLVAHGVPDLRVRTAQVYLMCRGFDPGPIDGEIGNRTRGALKQFQGHAGLPSTGEIDDATLAQSAAS
jgi:peptidoglycan hydrolase-like protein with peptidoglycan-binding domain